MLQYFKMAVFCCATLLMLSGCQKIIQPSLPSTIPNIQAEQQFNLQGKIGVRTPEQSGSAFFTWAQHQDDFDIELSGILGIGKTQIQGKPGQVTLNSSKTGLIQAETPEELLKQATGWDAPITHLIQWVQAKPATLHAQIQKNPANQIEQITEDGWMVNLNYNTGQDLPYRLIIKQLLDSGKENRITMVIQDR